MDQYCPKRVGVGVLEYYRGFNKTVCNVQYFIMAKIVKIRRSELQYSTTVSVKCPLRISPLLFSAIQWVMEELRSGSDASGS
jgi:hypothetical protein